MQTVYDELNGRGFVKQVSHAGIGDFLRDPATVYVGFDPTADSLHVGHLLPIIALAHFQRHGHKVIFLVGGATGMVGDPSGKSEERNLLTPEMVARNSAAVKEQLTKFLDFEGDNPVIMLDNNDWIAPMSFIDWLREVGKHFTVNYMLAKDSVKSRLASEAGISYTEFSYMTMQAYDFLYLFQKYGCRLQCGGDDQWGNITAGMELVRKALGEQVYCLTFPLLTTSSGEKFGKSAGNAIWLDANRLSPYRFYQFWMRTEDADVAKLLKLFTLVDLQEIDGICKEHEKAPDQRIAQKRLAEEMMRMVHGDAGLVTAKNASEVMYGGDLTGLALGELDDIFADVPSVGVSMDEVSGGVQLAELLHKSGLCASKSEARRLIKQGGCYCNNKRITDEHCKAGHQDFLHGAMMVLRAGKKEYCLVRIGG
jgi:tyrosyl-tRNA synthetase